MEPPCCALYFHRAPTNLWGHQFPNLSIDDDFIGTINVKPKVERGGGAWSADA